VDLLGRQRGEPGRDGGALGAPPHLLLEVLLDELGRAGGVAPGQRVPDGVVGQAVLGVPLRRRAVQLRHAVRVLGLQVGAEQIGEEVVVAPPPALLVERDQEQAGPLDRLEQLLAVGAPTTASQSGPHSRSRTEVSSRNVRSSRAGAPGPPR
jgi:hypothetical protein